MLKKGKYCQKPEKVHQLCMKRPDILGILSDIGAEWNRMRFASRNGN